MRSDLLVTREAQRTIWGDVSRTSHPSLWGFGRDNDYFYSLTPSYVPKTLPLLSLLHFVRNKEEREKRESFRHCFLTELSCNQTPFASPFFRSSSEKLAFQAISSRKCTSPSSDSPFPVEVSSSLFFTFPTFSLGFNCETLRMGRHRALLSSPEKIEEFRRKYNIPADVQFRLDTRYDLKEQGQDQTKIHIPLIFIVEGGLRLPLDPFFREVCERCQLNPMQLCPNFVRVVMGTLALNRLLGLHLDWWDLHYLYSVVPTAENNYYFKARDPSQKLITDLPNSSKGEADDYLVVTGNWEPRDAEGRTIGFACPTAPGRLR